MAFPTGKLNNYMWVAADNTERDLIGTDDGLLVGDRCVNLTSDAVDICLTAAAGSSTWEEGPTAVATGWRFPAQVGVAGADFSGFAATADDLGIGDGSVSVGMTFEPGAGNASSCFIHNGTNNEDGGWRYSGSVGNEVFTIRARNADRVSVHSGGFFPASDGGLASGFDGLNWSRLYLLDGVTAPGTPSSGAVLDVDSADGDLKVKFSDGFVAVIAADS